MTGIAERVNHAADRAVCQIERFNRSLVDVITINKSPGLINQLKISRGAGLNFNSIRVRFVVLLIDKYAGPDSPDKEHQGQDN